MHLGDIAGALRRRWLLATMGLLVVVLSAGFMMWKSSPTYSYSSTVLLLPPKVEQTTDDPSVPSYTQGNPLFFLGSLSEARDVLIASLTSSELQKSMADRFPSATYTATRDVLNSSPVVVITVEGTSDDDAAGSLAELTGGVARRLQTLQTNLGITRDAQITSHTLTEDTSPAVSHNDQIRRALIVAGGLGVLVVFLIGAVDAVRIARSRPDPDPPDRPTQPGRTPPPEGPTSTVSASMKPKPASASQPDRPQDDRGRERRRRKR